MLNADPKGQSVSYTKEHLFKRNHFDYAHLIEDTLKQPNEAWSFLDAGKKSRPLTHSYLRYYNGDKDNRIFVVIAKEEAGQLQVITSYFINRGDQESRARLFTNQRKGVLLHAIKRF